MTPEEECTILQQIIKDRTARFIRKIIPTPKEIFFIYQNEIVKATIRYKHLDYDRINIKAHVLHLINCVNENLNINDIVFIAKFVHQGSIRSAWLTAADKIFHSYEDAQDYTLKQIL